MKKEAKDNVPSSTDRAQEQAPSNVMSYFTKEINDRVFEMSIKEMESLMKEIVTTRYWLAMLKYSGVRNIALDSMLRVTNPYKDPFTISWAQGSMAGIHDLETYIIDLNTPKPDQKKDDKEGFSETKPDRVIMG